MGDLLQNDPMWDAPRENSIGDASTTQRFRRTTSFTAPGSSSWIVPANVFKIRVKMWGAGGGGSNGYTSASRAGSDGGPGSYIEIILDVTPGETLTIIIGAGGGAAIDDTSSAATGGVPGGGDGGPNSTNHGGGGAGGGLTAIKRGSTILVCAGAGAGAGGSIAAGTPMPGGAGDTTGTGYGSNVLHAGGPGTFSRGGQGGDGAMADGVFGASEAGGDGVSGGAGEAASGGGGAGIFGGGGGGVDSSGEDASSGGGGASYPLNDCEEFLYQTNGTKAAVKTDDPDYVPGASVGGTGSSAGAYDATAGGNGLIAISY